MKVAEAKRLLACYQPGHGHAPNRVQKAVQMARHDEELRQQLAAQEQFDSVVQEQIDRVPLPADLGGQLAAIGPGPRQAAWRRFFHNPALFAALLSVAVTVVLLGSGVLEQAEDFPGKEAVIKMIERARGMSGVELEPITPTELGRLGDWFAMNGMDRFVVPAELAPLRAIGCRVFKQNGFMVGQAAVEKSNVLVHVFNGTDLDVRPSMGGEWQTFRVDEWAGAIRRQDEICTMLALQGSESEIEDLLASLK